MTHIHDTLATIKEQDQKKFLTVRTAMRRAYLMAIAGTVGIQNYNSTDDTFMDAIDIKVEMLMQRAGIETPSNENRIAEENVNDVFSLITRPFKETKPTGWTSETKQ